MGFPTLYRQTKTGAIVRWVICVVGNTITTSWGQIDGAVQTTTDTISCGKNIGRSNETTPEEQAVSEAQSKWNKQVDEGYVESIEDAKAGKVSSKIAGGVFPMLAHRFDQHGDKIVYPAYVQPKLDGHRCIGTPIDGRYSLWSRKRKPILSMAHVVAVLDHLSPELRVVTDGELHPSNPNSTQFEQLTHFIKQSKTMPGCEIVQYHIYDVAIADTIYRQRLELVGKLVRAVGLPLVAVETILVADEDELMLAFEHFLELGYEGAIVRNAEGLYTEDARSYDLQKVKQFDDDEFEVVGVKEGRGKLAGHAVFDCVTKKGVHFDAKMKGPLAALKEFWEHPERATGRQMTVQYQGFTARGAARFPVALRFRDESL